MAENQSNPQGSANKSNNVTGTSNTSEARDGKAQGTPSNVSETTDTDTSKKNKEGNPDESKIQGGREESNTARTGSDTQRSTNDGGSI